MNLSHDIAAEKSWLMNCHCRCVAVAAAVTRKPNTLFVPFLVVRVLMIRFGVCKQN